jgi:hypothetical protein
MFRRDAFEKANGNRCLSYREDWNFCLRIAKRLSAQRLRQTRERGA